MPRLLFGHLPIAVVAIALVAVNDPGLVRAPGESAPSRAAEGRASDAGDALRQYGPAVEVGDGVVRTYLLRDTLNPEVPLEVGVALSEAAMDGLPTPRPKSAHAAAGHGNEHEHLDSHVYLLTLPEGNPTPYRFVELDWNPGGHEPPGIYDEPHFDFHFWTVSSDVRSSIVPTDPQYGQKAAILPGAEYRAQHYVDASTAAKAPAGAVAVPLMGLHWLDVRSPELQRALGRPEAYEPFTKTFIYGSWNGQFVFDEPMITRAYIVAKRDATDPAVRDEVVPVSEPQRHAGRGYHPRAYRIAYDAAAREYRIALTQLTPNR